MSSSIFSNARWPWHKARQRENCLRPQDLVAPSITPDAFVRGASVWEMSLHGKTSTKIHMCRTMLVSTLKMRRIEEVEWCYYFHRWVSGYFDSVTQKYFVLVNVLIPTLSNDETIVCDEVDVTGEYNGGRMDVSYYDLLNLKWGLDNTVRTCVGYREKISGSRFVRQGNYLVGCVTVKIPRDCPVQLLEWSWKGMIMLFPFALPTFDLDGLYFCPHPWRPMASFQSLVTGEGVMLLFHDKGKYTEKRLKRIPTTDVDLQRQKAVGLYAGVETGVWEVSWDFLKKQVIPMRPRPGKVSTYVNVSDLACVHDFAPLSELVIPLGVTNQLEENYTGSFRGYYLHRVQVLIVDSGFRPSYTGYGTFHKIAFCGDDPSPLPSWSTGIRKDHGLITYSTFHGGVVSPRIITSPNQPTCITGGKVFFFREINEKVQLAVMQDMGKGWDAVGGKIEPGESTQECVIREIMEEMKVQVNVDSLVYVGVSSAYDRADLSRGTHKEYHSFIYLCQWKDEYDRGVVPLKWIDGFVPPNDSVHWLGRLLQYVDSTVGGMHVLVPWYMGQTKGIPMPVVIRNRWADESKMWHTVSHGSTMVTLDIRGNDGHFTICMHADDNGISVEGLLCRLLKKDVRCFLVLADRKTGIKSLKWFTGKIFEDNRNFPPRHDIEVEYLSCSLISQWESSDLTKRRPMFF